MKEDILITIGDAFTEEAQSILKEIGEVRCIRCDRAEFLKELKDVTILVNCLDHRVDQEMIDAAPKLKMIAVPATGTDHIDVAYAKTKNIAVLSLKEETEFLRTITPTAELALGLMIGLLRHIPAAHRSILEGRWDRAAFSGHTLAGMTLGIIGYGRLGTMMGTYGKALGMEIVFTDPHVAGAISLQKLLQKSDVISLHVHLTKETERMIGAQEIRQMKPTAVLINTARGKIADEEALLAALEQGSLAGYATDVLADELTFTAKSARSKLIDYAKMHENVLITPHIGGNTAEARKATDIFIAAKVRDVLRAGI